MFQMIKINQPIKKIVIIIVLAVLILPNFVMAQTPTLTKGCEIPDKFGNNKKTLGIVVDTYKPIDINFNLPGVTKKVVENGQTYYQVKNLQCFIIGIYVYFSGVAGILATVMIMYGGVKYVISMGNPSRMGDAKDTIFSASVGLVLVLGAYVLLNLINPNLTSLKVPGLDLANVAGIPDYCTKDATPKIPGKTSCGDFGIDKLVQDDPNTLKKEIVNVDCVYEGCPIGEKCISENSAPFECKNEVFKWHDIQICTNSRVDCGIKDGKDGCIGIEGGACLATYNKDYKKNKVTFKLLGHYSKFKVDYTSLSVKGNLSVDYDYNYQCGIFKENFPIRAIPRLTLGTDCPANQHCVVMFDASIPESENFNWDVTGLRVTDSVGNFVESYCK